jgi:hypothetical protein
MKSALLAVFLATSAFGAANVQTSNYQLGNTNTWVAAFNWTADTDGSVPTTRIPLANCCQGYNVATVETVPGTPAPTAGYGVAITDGAGVDVLGGSGVALSASAAQAFPASPAATPIQGTLNLVLTGNVVSGAKGVVYIFMAKPGTFNALNLGRNPSVATGYVLDANAIANGGQPYPTLASACTAANAVGATLVVSLRWNNLLTQALSCPIMFLAGGILKPASGQTVTLSASIAGTLTQHFDPSAGGSILLTGAIAAIYPQWFGSGLTADDTAAFTAMFAASSGKALVFPAGSYTCANTNLASRFTVLAASFEASGATFLGCMFTTTGAPAGISLNGGFFDTTAYPFAGTAAGPIWQISKDHTRIKGSRFKYRRNYTAIQIAGATNPSCIDDTKIADITTETNGQSHITPTCVTNLQIDNWTLGDGGLARDPGLGNYDDGLALDGLSGSTHDVSLTNITASHVYNILKIQNTFYPIYGVTLKGFTCTECVTPVWIEATKFNSTAGSAMRQISVSNGTVTDLTGAVMTNAFYLYGDQSDLQDVTFQDIKGYGRLASAGQGWVRFLGLNGAVFDNVNLLDLTFITAGSSGFAPSGVIFGQNNAAWTNFRIRNLSTNGSTGACLQLGTVQFSSITDLRVTDSYETGCNSAATASPANIIYGRAVWERNRVVPGSTSQVEVSSINSAANPVGISYSEMMGTFNNSMIGTQFICYDCQQTTPVKSSGTGAIVTKLAAGWSAAPATIGAINYIPAALENGANNAIACAAGCGPAVPLGATDTPLVVQVQLAHTLVAGGPNTFAYNGGAPAAVNASSTPLANITRGYAAGGVITLMYKVGCCWMDMAQ